MKTVDFINSKTDGIPEIILSGDIDFYDGANIASQILNADSKHIRIRVNSFGGNVLAGYEIISAINQKTQNGEIVETLGLGITDSVAGWIVASGTKGYRKVMPFNTMLLHPPATKDGLTAADLPDGELKNKLLSVADAIENIFTANTNLSKSKVRSFMENETTFTALEAKKAGLIDSIIKIDNTPQIAQNLSRLEVYNITKNFTPKIKNLKYMKELIGILNLNENAGDADVRLAIQNLKTEKTTFENKYNESQNEIKDLKAENTAFKNRAEKLENEKFEDYVDALIEKDASKKEHREALVNMAKGNFDAFKTLNPIQDIIINNNGIDDGIEPNGDSQTQKEKAAEFANMTAAARKELRAKNPIKFNELFNASFK